MSPVTLNVMNNSGFEHFSSNHPIVRYSLVKLWSYGDSYGMSLNTTCPWQGGDQVQQSPLDIIPPADCEFIVLISKGEKAQAGMDLNPNLWPYRGYKYCIPPALWFPLLPYPWLCYNYTKKTIQKTMAMGWVNSATINREIFRTHLGGEICDFGPGEPWVEL